MKSIGGVGPGLPGARIAVALQAAVLRQQVAALKTRGELAIQLIEAAVIDPEVGQKIDVRI